MILTEQYGNMCNRGKQQQSFTKLLPPKIENTCVTVNTKNQVRKHIIVL